DRWVGPGGGLAHGGPPPAATQPGLGQAGLGELRPGGACRRLGLRAHGSILAPAVAPPAAFAVLRATRGRVRKPPARTRSRSAASRKIAVATPITAVPAGSESIS